MIKVLSHTLLQWILILSLTVLGYPSSLSITWKFDLQEQKQLLPINTSNSKEPRPLLWDASPPSLAKEAGNGEPAAWIHLSLQRTGSARKRNKYKGIKNDQARFYRQGRQRTLWAHTWVSGGALVHPKGPEHTWTNDLIDFLLCSKEHFRRLVFGRFLFSLLALLTYNRLWSHEHWTST